MKNQKIGLPKLIAMLIMFISFNVTHSFAQTNSDSTMKDCCMMKDGKMMQIKSGKMQPMEENMTMSNGTMCMMNGECIMKDGKKMNMKEGDCIDMSGKMDHCSMMHKDGKGASEKKEGKQDMDMSYSCPMHSDVKSNIAGKCTKCGMELEKKK